MCDSFALALSTGATENLSDGDYRTYAFIVMLATKTDHGYVELGYDDLARTHSGSMPLSPAAVRARIGRLIDAGLLRRERAGRTCWRTWVVPIVGAISDSTQNAQDDLVVTPDSTQESSCTDCVLPDSAPTLPTDSMDALAACTQAGAGLAEDAVGATVDHTQTSAGRLRTMPHNAPTFMSAISTRTQPPDLIPELPDRALTEYPHSSQSGSNHEQRRPETSTVTALERELRCLTPKPMNAAGIAECLRAPELAAAWLVWVKDPANGVESPAAYLRAQVRRGHFPPQATVERSSHAHRDRQRYASRGSRALALAPADAGGGVALAACGTTRWPLDAGAV